MKAVTRISPFLNLWKSLALTITLALPFAFPGFPQSPFNFFIFSFLWNWLTIDWKQDNFINPPYSQKLKEKFIMKALWESRLWKNCVMLLPVSTDTKIFHEVILPFSKHIEFIKWRIKFSWYNTKGEWVSNKCGMHWSMLVYF